MNEDLQKVRDLITDVRFAMLTTTEDGRLVSRPMTPLRIDDGFRLLFLTQRDTDLAGQAPDQQVNLSFTDKRAFVSLSGTARILNDAGLKKELWNLAAEAYTDQGPEDPNSVVLAVSTDSASYWESASAPVTVTSMLKAAITDDKPRSGEHNTVELDSTESE